jgi:hypothetical protein
MKAILINNINLYYEEFEAYFKRSSISWRSSHSEANRAAAEHHSVTEPEPQLSETLAGHIHRQ